MEMEEPRAGRMKAALPEIQGAIVNPMNGTVRVHG
jgi:hypothetical protein